MPNLSIEKLARYEAIEDAVERWLARPMHEDASNGELVHDLIACGVVLGDQRGPYPEPPEGNIFCSADDHQYDFATGEAELTAPRAFDPSMGSSSTMKALVHLPDPTHLTFVSPVRLEVGDEVGIWVPCAYCDAVERGRPIPEHGKLPAVVATSTITEAERFVVNGQPNGTWSDPPYPDVTVWRYSLAPLRECPPITDLPCPSVCGGVPARSSATMWCERCNGRGRVPLPEVPTGSVVLL